MPGKEVNDAERPVNLKCGQEIHVDSPCTIRVVRERGRVRLGIHPAASGKVRFGKRLTKRDKSP
jgi:hypothetical protein